MPGIEIIKDAIPNQKEANRLMERLLDTARPGAVFGEPITQGEYMAITASEVSAGIGYGFGGGAGIDPGEGEKGDEETSEVKVVGGYGSGGGGGGGIAARPVAVIEIGPHGVSVEPIVDPTKIAIAFFTTIGSIFLMGARMKKKARGL
jgi:uncharacterized spore protein YtfJ